MAKFKRYTVVQKGFEFTFVNEKSKAEHIHCFDTKIALITEARKFLEDEIISKDHFFELIVFILKLPLPFIPVKDFNISKVSETLEIDTTNQMIACVIIGAEIKILKDILKSLSGDNITIIENSEDFDDNFKNLEDETEVFRTLSFMLSEDKKEGVFLTPTEDIFFADKTSGIKIATQLYTSGIIPEKALDSIVTIINSIEEMPKCPPSVTGSAKKQFMN